MGKLLQNIQLETGLADNSEDLYIKGFTDYLKLYNDPVISNMLTEHDKAIANDLFVSIVGLCESPGAEVSEKQQDELSKKMNKLQDNLLDATKEVEKSKESGGKKFIKGVGRVFALVFTAQSAMSTGGLILSGLSALFIAGSFVSALVFLMSAAVVALLTIVSAVAYYELLPRDVKARESLKMIRNSYSRIEKKFGRVPELKDKIKELKYKLEKAEDTYEKNKARHS